MTDSGRDDFDTLRRRLRRQSRTRPFEAQMREFVRNHGTPDDLTELCESVKTGGTLSETVKQDRDERP